MAQSKNQFDQVMKGLEKLDDKVDKIRTEDVPGLHTRITVLEKQFADVKSQSKRDARVYGGIGSAVATCLAIAMSFIRH